MLSTFYATHEAKYSSLYCFTSASNSSQLSSNKGPLMILFAMDNFGSLCSGLLHRSIVIASALVSSMSGWPVIVDEK